MKTSMAYRLYRLYFNSNADNHQLFGNRVYNPINEENGVISTQAQASVLRLVLFVAAIAAIASIAAV